MHKSVYLGLSLLELNKMVMYEFWHDYVKPKGNEKAKLCYTDTDSCSIAYMKMDDICKDVVEDVETSFDTSNYELDRPLLKGKNKKVFGSINDELGGKVIIPFVTLRARTYSYLIDEGSENKKAKFTKKCVIKRKLKYENFKNYRTNST